MAILSEKEKKAFTSRLKEAVGDLSLAELQRRSGLRNTVIRDYLNGSMPSMDRAIALSRAIGVSIEWLATGEKGVAPADNFVLVPRYEVSAAAGTGIMNHDERVSENIPVAQRLLASMGIRHKDLAIIQVDGKSMEPDIPDGSLVLIDIKDREARAEHIYVIDIAGELVVKAVQLQLNGSIKLLSHNQAFSPIPVSKEEKHNLRVLGRVCGLIRKY